MIIGPMITSINRIISFNGWTKLLPIKIIPASGKIAIMAIYVETIPMIENFSSPASILVKGGTATPGGAQAKRTKPIHSWLSLISSFASSKIIAPKTK